MKKIYENDLLVLNLNKGTLSFKNDKGDIFDHLNLYGLQMKDLLGISTKDALDNDLKIIGYMLSSTERKHLDEMIKGIK